MSIIPQLILGVLTGYFIYAIVCIIHGSFTSYTPEKEEIIYENLTATAVDTTFSIASWNIGYAGLGKDNDNFYDAGGFLTAKGRQIKPTKEQYDVNFNGIKERLTALTASTDFFFLQEIDKASKRSYFQDQFLQLPNVLKGYHLDFATNYQCTRVPIPLFSAWDVMGKVHSGIVTGGKTAPLSSVRYQLPGSFSWPSNIFHLDRCMMVNTYPVKGKKGKLLMINIHNSAYDNGKLKAEEMAFIRDFVLKAYQAGNYVVLGGDWNQNPPNFHSSKLTIHNNGKTVDPLLTSLPADYFPMDWTFGYDAMYRTNRSIDRPFDTAVNIFDIIDFYLVSPNVIINKVKCVDMSFQYSDHQPVLMSVSLQ